MKPIYLDYNATTPIAKEVADAMLPFLYGRFGNPSSSHAYGIEAKQAVENARASIAQMIGALREEIIFTSGGSEANNLAIQGAALSLRERGNHLITSSIEHPAVLEVCAALEKQGFQVTYLPIDSEGLLDPEEVRRALRPTTILVTLMLANNEIGTLQPVREVARLCKERGILVHTDAAQAIGKIPVNVKELGVDLLSLAGH
ncbi:MAG: cysteine desulfurase family protein, partial [Spirochaetales bacterium]